jgi:hypothetical protein
MSRIIAARMGTTADAEAAIGALSEQGVRHDDMSLMYLSPPGQHATYPIGGDRKADENARHADKGARAGAVVGAGAGAVVAAAVAGVPVVGIPAALAAIGVGAYAGSLAGSLAASGHAEGERAQPQARRERPAGLLLAVRMDAGRSEADAIAALRAHGGQDIEGAEGEWRDGRWTSFNPLDLPRLLEPDRRAAR